ncbi:MAG: preprotein translocase subunit Sec61beta [archaeon]
MAREQGGVQMPGGFGGLMRFSEEYDSKINLKPTHVILFIILIIVFRVGLGMFYGG